jgi:hypothetical protein
LAPITQPPPGVWTEIFSGRRDLDRIRASSGQYAGEMNSFTSRRRYLPVALRTLDAAVGTRCRAADGPAIALRLVDSPRGRLNEE